MPDTPSLDDVQNYWNANPAGYAEVEHLRDDRIKFFDERDRQTRLLYPQIEGQYKFVNAQGKLTLELGCGMGYNAQRLAQCGAKLVAMDLAPQAVQLTQERFALRKLAANFVVADAEHLPFANETFEMIFSSGVIHHSPSTQAAANEITRALKTAGQATVMIYHRDSIWFWWDIIAKLGMLLLVLNYLPAFLREQILQRVPRWRYYLLPKGQHLTLTDIIRAGTDFGGLQNPISRVYTQKTAKQLFAGLRDIDFVISDATFRPFATSPAFVLKIGRRIRDWLNTRYGFYLTLHGKK